VVDKLNPDNHDFQSILYDGFARTYDTLTKANKEIYVVVDNPYYPENDAARCRSSVVKRPVALPSVLYSPKTGICSTRQKELTESKMTENWIKTARYAAAGYKNINFIDLEQIFCHNGTCSMLDSESNVLYRDGGHLNINGSIHVAPFIMSMIRQHIVNVLNKSQ